MGVWRVIPLSTPIIVEKVSVPIESGRVVTAGAMVSGVLWADLWRDVRQERKMSEHE